MHYSIRSIRHKNNNTRLGVNMTTLAKQTEQIDLERIYAY
nr:MAG TPA: hypothetical protein [Caudoviricetes sp.]DAM47421.1 MAG TPA: hypothetical protein [Caudoviricetes sp.]